MRKYLSIMFALLLVVSVAGVALSHQATYDPSNTSSGQGAITVPVYNNSGGSLDAGDVVIWDIGSSTGDNDYYVTTTTTANTGLVAGVVWPSAISAASEGSIAIWGIAECDVDAKGSGANSPICTSGTAGAGTPCTGAGTLNNPDYAIITATTSASGQGTCFVNP